MGVRAKPGAPSAEHKNRRAHNWLLYDLIDRDLVRCAGLIGPVLYDLGCGTSPYRRWLEQYCDEYVGVDWPSSPHDIQPQITANLNEKLPVPDGVADTVLAMDVMEHLEDPGQFLTEAARILKPHGDLIIRVPWQWWVHEAPHDYHRFTPYSLTMLAQRAGFTEVCIKPQGGVFSMLALKLCYFMHRFEPAKNIFTFPLKALRVPFAWSAQTFAPILDKLDAQPELESCGYFMTAKNSKT